MAEKVTFLLGDAPAWLATTYKLKEKKSLTKDFISKKKMDARIRLNRKVKELYGKRSGFAHAGLGEEAISADDFNEASLLVRWTVERLLQVRKGGVSHIEKESSTDTIKS